MRQFYIYNRFLFISVGFLLRTMGRRLGTRQSERDTESCLGQIDRRHMQNA